MNKLDEDLYNDLYKNHSIAINNNKDIIKFEDQMVLNFIMEGQRSGFPSPGTNFVAPHSMSYGKAYHSLLYYGLKNYHKKNNTYTYGEIVIFDSPFIKYLKIKNTTDIMHTLQFYKIIDNRLKEYIDLITFD